MVYGMEWNALVDLEGGGVGHAPLPCHLSKMVVAYSDNS